jgi:hypothetical protein
MITSTGWSLRAIAAVAAPNPEDELALDADVEHAAPEGDRNREAREDQGRGGNERLGDGPDRRRHGAGRGVGEGGTDLGRVAEGADHHRVVGVADIPERARDRADRVGSQLRHAVEVRDQDEDRADDERRQDRQDRDDRGLEGTADTVHAAPPISMPTFS